MLANDLFPGIATAPETPFYRELDINNILKLVDGPTHQKSVVIAGDLGAGKSSLMVELARRLETTNRTFHSFDMRELESGNLEETAVRLNEEIEMLQKFIKSNPVGSIILMDSGDATLQAEGYPFKSYDKLSTLFKQNSLNEEDRHILEVYSRREKIIRVISDSNSQIITTQHLDVPRFGREERLYKLWKETFPENCKYTLDPRLETKVGLDYLLNRKDLGLTPSDIPLLRKMSETLRWMDLKLITSASFELLKKRLDSVPTDEWINIISAWQAQKESD